MKEKFLKFIVNKQAFDGATHTDSNRGPIDYKSALKS